jgi:prepilin-type N-terminal cleavage/methylation domain-containing protein
MHRTRLAFTLIEITVVLAVLGAIAVAATSMLAGARVTQSLQARNEADVLANAFRMARATAITNNVTVRVEAIVNRQVVGFRVSEPYGQLAMPETIYPTPIICLWSAGFVDFLPTGTTDKSLQVSFAGDNSDWVLDLLSGSGQVTMSQRSR